MITLWAVRSSIRASPKRNAYGYTKYLDVTDDARSKVPRDSEAYKLTYRLRTEVECYFSLLGEREAEQTAHYKLRSIKNQMTIAHLALRALSLAQLLP